jgi:glycosyltransferase involved in cell wall biosynthesis
MPHVLQVFQPSMAGVPNYVATLSLGLARRGWRVSVALPPDAVVRRELEDAGIATVPLQMRRRPAVMGDARVVRALTRYCRSADVDLIHGHSTKGGLLAALVSWRGAIPSVYTPHGWSFEMRVPVPARFVLAGYEAILARWIHRLVITVGEQERIAGERWRALPRARRASAVATAPSALDVVPVPGPARAALGLSEAATVVAWIGRLSRQKRPEDLPVLARALTRHGITLLAAGPGIEGSLPGTEMVAAGGRLVPLGTPVGLIYAAADVLVQTSAWEGLPLVVLEAMQAGLPVVAYRVGGLSEQVIDGHTGHLVDVGDLDVMIERCVDLARRPQGRMRMGAAGRRRIAQRFGRRAMLDGIEYAYRSVTNPAR